MKEEIKKAVERYQCPGCVCGSDTSCYAEGLDFGCSKHCPGTVISGAGKILLGMPKGFNLFESHYKVTISIFEKFEYGWGYNKFNVPVWKHLDNNGNTLVRGVCPRISLPWIHIFLGNHMSKIDCIEISKEDMRKMD